MKNNLKRLDVVFAKGAVIRVTVRSCFVMGVWLGAVSLALAQGNGKQIDSKRETRTGSKVDSLAPLPREGGNLQQETSEITHIRLWLGKKPAAGGQGVEHGNERMFVLKDLKLAEAEAYDSQLQTKLHYRGINLRDLIAVISPMPPSVDIIVLHTSNGMRIPIAINDLTLDRQIFLATEFKKDGKWSKDFPVANPPKAEGVVFRGNKLVVGTPFQKTSPTAFSPWDYAASLTGVEALESRAYYRSFNRVDGKSTSLGHTLFQGRCWTCHNVRGEGGQWGPDLTKIQELEDLKGIKTIYQRVVGPKSKKDPALTHSMPYQTDISQLEIKSLWFWLREIKAERLAPYDPTYQNSVRWE